MSFQQQPLNVANDLLKYPPTLTNPADPMSRYLPPTTTTTTNIGSGQNQQQQQQPQQQPPLRQQLYTNGVGPGSSNNSSRTASPAFSQPINSAYLPPSHQPPQQHAPLPPLPTQARPNVYGASTRVTSPTLLPPAPNQQLTSSPSSQPTTNNLVSTSGTVTSLGNNSTLTSGNARITSSNQQLPPPPTLPITSNLNQSSVDKMASNLQQLNLQNHTNGTLSPVNRQPPQPQPEKPVNGNYNFTSTATIPPAAVQQYSVSSPPLSTPTTTTTIPRKPEPQQLLTNGPQTNQLFSNVPTPTTTNQLSYNRSTQPIPATQPPQLTQAPQSTPPLQQTQPVNQSKPSSANQQLNQSINNNNVTNANNANNNNNNISNNNNPQMSNAKQIPAPLTAAQQQPPPLASQPALCQHQQFNTQLPAGPLPPTIASQATAGKRPMYPPQQQPSYSSPVQSPQNQYNNGSNQFYQQSQQLPPQMPTQQQPQYSQYTSNQQVYNQQYQQQQQMAGGGYNSSQVVNQGFNKMWGQNTIDLMQQRHILPPVPVAPPKIHLDHQFYESVNCSPEILRCTLTKIPESNSLLQKSRLPLGILIHPFRDLNNLPVIQCSTIVRCRSCRTYINPFVYFVDSKKWKCNLCYRVNELPDEFQYDPVSKSYGDVTRRPEVKSSTIEFIAPSEYMLRPPQPAVYLFLLDVSLIAQQSGYLQTVCNSLIEHLDTMPGDARTQIGFVTYNSAVHFYSIADGFNQPHEITVVDIDDPFLPCPDNLLINLKECKELIKDLLTLLPNRFKNTHDNSSALGAALQVAFKLMQPTGGRVTVFQTCLPNIGPGALQSRENPNERSSKDVQHLGPATDFYKRQALECSGQQIAVDLFLLNSQYSDLATLSGISKFSGGCIHHFPLFNIAKSQQVEAFKKCFERYLTRKIGFESVMRVRCTRGLAIHTFHGNFFVRSTDLLSLPNVNPDAGFGMQISYEESLGESKTVCFQAALLYTSSKGERRIRVHTLCLPVSSSLVDVIYSADAQAIIGLISKMAVDRSLQSSLSDARDAFINASCDVFSAFRLAQNISQIGGQLIAPANLTLLPMYMLALLKHTAFRTGTSTRLDDRVFAMCELKTLPLDQLIRFIYPDLYHIDCLFDNSSQVDQNGDKPDPPLLQLSAEYLKSRSMFLLDCGLSILILVGGQVPPAILQSVFGVASINEIPDLCCELPSLGTNESENLHAFIEAINLDKPYSPTIQIIRENSPYRSMFTERLVDDRSESSLSYYEFLQHLRSQVK